MSVIPDHSSNIVSLTRRHPQYYFADGNVVLQVGGVLFKIHSSLLTQESGTFRDMFTLPAAQNPPDQQLIECERDTQPQEGTCDENPIIIPGVTQHSFSNFLFVFYGRPSNPEFRSMMKDIGSIFVIANNSFYRLHQYLDIADLSHRFAAPNLEAWALGQLKGLSNFTKDLALGQQNLDYQLRAISYAKRIQDKNLEHRMRTFVELSHSFVLREHPEPPKESEAENYRRNLLKLFKYPNLQKDHPSLFGFIFCVTLSLGHEFWLHHPLLVRDDRIILLSAQAHLTPLPFSVLGLDWLEGTLTAASPHGTDPELQSCARCNFQPTWEQVFGGQYTEGMKKKESLLGGVNLLALLVVKRMIFKGALPGFGFALVCTNNCKERFIEFVDEKIEHVFTRFADFYKDIE